MPEPKGHVHGDACESSGGLVSLGDPEERRPQRKPMRFVSLHHHSTFSYLDGFRMPEAHVERAAELNMGAMALTEHGNVSSHVKLEAAAEAAGIKPLFGVEAYCGGTTEETRSQRKNHLTVLAENQEGYRNMLRMVTRSYEDYYYEPTTSWDNLVKHSKGLILLSGCTGSLLATSLIGGKLVDPADASFERGLNVARKFKREFGDSYYLEVQAFPELENVRRLNPMIAEIGRRLDIPLVATGDIHYTRPSEAEMQMILHNVRGGNKKTLEDMAREWGYDVPLSHPLTDKAIFNRLVATGLTRQQARDSILATEEIAQRCTVKLPKLPPLRFPLPPGFKTSKEVWREWLKQGWNFRGFRRLPPAERRRYSDRLKYEMKIIEDKDFIDYFLVVSDLVKYAKDSGIPVGPARGSAAGSLVCYLLRITEVNPMLFPSLVFERFIEPTRADLPDIDLDFDSERRHEIRNYLVAKYGAKQVSNIGTFGFYKSKVSLDDVARVYRIPQFEVDKVKDLLLERSSGDLRASATIEDTVEMFDQAREVVEKYPDLRKAMDLEGNIKQFGVHAAGLVVSSGPIEDVVGVYAREVKGELIDVIAVDKRDAERQNILKIDALGLSTMTMISRALREIGMELQDLYDLPLDDEHVIDGFRENDVVGIFQFDGRAMRSVNAELQPDSFKEICDVNALARPGPLHNNASAEYIDIKRGRKEPRRFHPLCDEITKDTHYQIVYQEQIMRICGEVGGFDHTHRTTIRKIISHKHGEQEFNRWWDKFRKGAAERGVDEESAKAIWGAMITAGSYAFNAAHCVAYGMLAYWTMWLKRYHPEAFYVASLNAYGDKKALDLLRDADRHGIEILPPDVKLSEEGWTTEGDGAIRAGLSQIPGVGKAVAGKIIEFRKDNPVETWADLKPVPGIGDKTIAKFYDFCGQEDPFGVHKLKNTLNEVRDMLRSGKIRYRHPYGHWARVPTPTHTSLQVPYSRGDDTPVVWMGMLRHRNLRELFEVNFSRTGVPLNPDEVRRPDLNEWVIAVGVDEDELLTITFDRFKYPKFKDAIWGVKLDHDVVVIRGVKRGYQSRRAIYASELYVISMDDEGDD